MLYKAGRPSLKVCGLPVPTARKYRYTYSRLYRDSHIGDQMINVSVTEIRLWKLDEVGCLVAWTEVAVCTRMVRIKVSCEMIP